MRFEIKTQSTGSRINKIIFQDVEHATSAGSPESLDILVEWKQKDRKEELLGEISKLDIRRLGKAV